MTDAGAQYGVPDEDQRKQYAAVLGHAFGFDVVGAAGGWFEQIGHDNLRVVHDCEGVRAGLALVPMGQFFGGSSVPMTGFAAVAVRSDALRRGVASNMMRRALRELGDADVPIAALYASTTSLYRRVGFEAAGSRFVAELAPSDIRIREHALPVRRATAEDHPSVEALYRRLAPAHDGHLDRGRYIWNRLYGERFGVQAHGILVDEDGELSGYAFYRNHKIAGVDRHRVEITDLNASSGAALRRLWTFFGDLFPMVESIDLHTAPHDAAFLVHPELRVRMRLHENWLLRIVDLPRAFEGRGYAPSRAGTIELEVSDDVLPANAGRWRITVEGGHARVQRGGGGTVRCDIRGLVALYSGFASPAALVTCERMEGPPDAVRDAVALFAGGSPWMREMF